MYRKNLARFLASIVLVVLLLLFSCSNDGNSSLDSNAVGPDVSQLGEPLTSGIQLHDDIWGTIWNLSVSCETSRYIGFNGRASVNDPCAATWDRYDGQLIMMEMFNDGDVQYYKLKKYGGHLIGASHYLRQGMYLNIREIFSVVSDPDSVFNLNKASAMSLDSIRAYMEKNPNWFEGGGENE